MERTNLPLQELVRVVTTLVDDAARGMARAFDVHRIGVLRCVAELGPVRPGAVSDQLDIAPSSVTRHVQALEDAGQLRVTPDPDDGRTCLLQITATGRDELDQIERIGSAVFAEVVADWDPGDVAALTRLLRRLTADWAARGPAARRHPRPHRPPRWRHPPTADTQQPDPEELPETRKNA